MKNEIVKIDDNNCYVKIPIAAPKEQVEQGAIAIALRYSRLGLVCVLSPTTVEDAVEALCNKSKQDWLALMKEYEDEVIEAEAKAAAESIKEAAEATRLSNILGGS
jgi:predicted glycosyltransferase